MTVSKPASRIIASRSEAACDVQRGFAGEGNRVAVAPLPGDQVRQQLLRRPSVGDEVVVDEVNRAVDAAFEQFVELAGDLSGSLQQRNAAIKAGNVAKFATVGTTTGELDAAQEVAIDLSQFVGRRRAVGERSALVGGQHHLLWRPGAIRGQTNEQLLGRVAQLAEVKVVELAIIVRAGRHRRPAEHGRPAGQVGATTDVVDLPTLNVHAADEHRLGPREVGLASRRQALVDETEPP
jgi:hypothetical protein